MLIVNGLKPFTFASGNGNVVEPRILGCAVPVLDTVLGHNDVACGEFTSCLAVLLILAFTFGHQQNLVAAHMFVPVIAATGFKADVCDHDVHVVFIH